MRHLYLALALVLAAAGAATTAIAVEPDEILDDPALEARARALSADIRCLVCQNESIDSSNADMAKDLRVLVRDRLVTGDTDQEVRNFLVERYGDFVLLNPPVKPTTYLLWFGPGLLLLLGLGTILVYLRRQGGAAPVTAPLSESEKARLDALLADDGDARSGPDDSPQDRS